MPRLTAVGGTEQCGILYTGVDRVRIGERGLQMPDSLELPRVLRAIVPLVSAGYAVLDELVVHGLPRLPSVVGALNHLTVPAGGLGHIQPIRIGGRTLQMVDLPAPKVRTADVPLFALSVGRQDERALTCTHQHPYLAHVDFIPPAVSRTARDPIDTPAQKLFVGRRQRGRSQIRRHPRPLNPWPDFDGAPLCPWNPSRDPDSLIEIPGVDQ